ncbi:tetratricopeptide repeat protein [Kribbella sp. NPDC051952]|uniref:tetratricopeptide repeat protein n=1 Tax=Kribbella sp. NPDC051952 TaxID=3154851 RepID=UPI003440CB6A
MENRVQELYERAIFNGEYDGLTEADRALDAVEADLLVQRGRIMHCRFFEDRVENPDELPAFERAAELYRGVGDQRGEGEAQFWIGCFHHVIRGDTPTAVRHFTTAADLARETGDDLTLSYALRHLGIAAHSAGDLDTAKALLEESTELRRALGFTAGVAANLVGLIYLAMAQSRPDDAHKLADEAAGLAASVGATKVSEDIETARAQI